MNNFLTIIGLLVLGLYIYLAVATADGLPTTEELLAAQDELLADYPQCERTRGSSTFAACIATAQARAKLGDAWCGHQPNPSACYYRERLPFMRPDAGSNRP